MGSKTRYIIGAAWLFAAFHANAATLDSLSFQPLQGGKPVTMAALHGHKTLVAFWRSDCAPCLHEMAILPAIVRENPTLPMVLVSLQDRDHTRESLQNMAFNMQVLVAQNNGGDVMRAFGNSKASLPFSVMLRADGSVCATHEGILGTQRINEWVKRC